MMQQSRQDTLASLGLSSSSLSVTFATCFQAASISKPISAMAVMRLVQRGVLDLDTDIHEYLKHSNDTEEVAEKGEWKLPVSLPDGIVGVKTPITLRLLFGHAAGTSVWGFDGYNRKQVREGKLKVPSTLGILKGEGNSPKVELNCVPNTVHQYSGGGTTIIQFVVKRVTGKPFWKVIEEEVVVPLKLEHTVVTLEDSPNGGDFACGHMFSDCIPVPGGYHLYPESAAAGVWTTPMDICKIQTALFKSFCGETIDGKMFLAKDLAKEMVTPRFAASSGACLGIGWMMPEVPNREFAHGGMNEGYVCDTFTLLESGAGITWMASSERQSFEVMNEASKAIGQVYGFGEWQQQETTTQPEEEVPASLDECVGNFQLVVPDTLFDADFVGPVIRVERSLKPRDGKNSLDFCFESLEGRVSCSSHDSDDAFRFQVMPRMDAKFVKARGKTTLQFGRNVFVQE
ncbi:beta-lactamase/transpeptidase-like protein [Obelidium mucronatum]|nr:beta-lactamase/transpeptidase-like protein [Obelidium mucronatum]